MPEPIDPRDINPGDKLFLRAPGKPGGVVVETVAVIDLDPTSPRIIFTSDRIVTDMTEIIGWNL